MHHPEPVAKRFLFQVAQSRIRDVFKRSVAKEFAKGLVIDCNDQVTAAEHEVASLVQGVCHGQRLSLDGRVPRLCWVGEAGSDECYLPPLLAAEDLEGWALAVLLEYPVPNPVFAPVSCQAGWTVLIEDPDSLLDPRTDLRLGGVKGLL